ncbi:MAG: membrane protein insertion efficiency factor YidD [Omnitrophica WOR_2 bacterium RIFCSPHIGHO2_01_FULL_48_9]|nr:MAG: membrane protein insertion efficiency factor YidD [Omnitrophica WOR_2 bacterium RIFCSPHIGHO2_01_FULL_48_9]
MTQIAIFIIKIYQDVTRHIFPKACRFYPSCSQYAHEALLRYGFLKGIAKAILRIVRCSPLFKGGYDPVK